MENTTETPIAEPSTSDLRAMLTGTVKEPEPEPTTAETAEEKPAEETQEPEAAAGEKQPEPEKSDEDEPLPEGVQKRIAKEVEKAARIQAEIDRAVSARKAKEEELRKLSGEKGSEPVKKPQSPETPERPVVGEKGHENETWDDYQVRERAYFDKRDEWLKAEAVKEFREIQARETAQRSAQEKYDAAVAKHGKEFPALMERARELAPEGLQVAVSSLDNWDTVAVHLAKNPAQLQELAQTFNQNPTKAIATLGRIEAALISKETKPATTEKPLPKPLAKVGGTASASGQSYQEFMETASIGQIRAHLSKLK